MYGIPEKLIAYREELKKLYNSLCCVICMDLFKEPVTTTCGHTFCHHCIDKVTKVAKSTCPLCKTAVTRRHVTENPQIKALVEAYRTLAKEFRNAGVEMNFSPASPQSELEVVHVIAPAKPKSSKLGKKMLPQSNPSLAHGLLVNLPKNANTKEISDTPKIPSRQADNIVNDNQLPSTSCDVLSTPPLLESWVSKSLNVASTPAEKDPYTFVPSQRSPEKKRAPKKRQTRTKSNQKATAFLRSNAKRSSKTSSTAEPTTAVSTDKLQNALSRQSLEEREFEVVLFESQPSPNDNRTLEDIPVVTIPESPQKKRRGTPKKRAQQVTAKASKKADVEEQIESIRFLFDDIDKQELNIVPSSNVEARKENSLQTKTRKKVTFQDHQDQSISIEPRPSTSTSNSTLALDISAPTVTTDSVAAEKIPESVDVISRSSTNDPGQISRENAAVAAFSTGTVANVKRSSPGWSRLQEMKQDLGNNKKGLVAIAIKQGRDSLSKSIHRLPKTHVDIALDSRVRKPTEVQPVSAISTSKIATLEPASNSLPEPVTDTKLVQDVANVKQSTEGLAQIENHQSETPAVLAIAETQEISPEPVTKSVVCILNEGVEPQVPLATAHAQSKSIIFVKKGRLATLKKGLAKKAILFHSLGALRKEKTFLSYGKRPFAFIDDFSDSETQTMANKKHCTDNVQAELCVRTDKVFKNTSVQTDEGWSFENRAVLGMFVGDAEKSVSVSLADTLPIPIVSETNKSDQKDVEILDTEPVSHIRQLEKTDSDDMDIPDTVPVPEILNFCDNAKPSLEGAEEPVSISVNRTSARMSLLSTSCALPRYSLASTAQFDNEASSDSSLISSPEKLKTVMERIRANNDDLYSSEADGSPEPRQSHRIVAKVLPGDTTSKSNKKRKFRRIRTANSSDSDSEEEIKVAKESKRNKLSNTAAVKKRADMEREVEELSSQLQPEGDSEEILQLALEESKRELFEAGHLPAVEIVSLTGSSTTKVSRSEGSTAARSPLYPTATRNVANMQPFITSTTKSCQSPILTLQRSDSAKSASSGGIPSPSQSILASAAVARTRTSKTYNSPPRTANSGLFSMESMPTLASEALDADTYLFGEANDNGKLSPFKVLPKSLETMDLEAAVLQREEASLAGPKSDLDDLFDEDEYATDIFIGLDAELCKLEANSSARGKSVAQMPPPTPSTSGAKAAPSRLVTSNLPQLESPRAERTRIFESDDDLIEPTPEDERNRSWRNSREMVEHVKSPQKSIDRSPLVNLGVGGRNPTDHNTLRAVWTASKVSGIVPIAKPSISDERPASPVPKKVALMCTGLERHDILAVQTLAQRLDLNLLSNVSSSVTHVVVKADENMTTERTFKYLYGVASGAWVVDMKWITDSLKENKLLPEAPYEVLDLEGEPGPRRGREIKGTLFKSFTFCCVLPFTHMTMDNMNDMVRLCGSALVSHPKDLLATTPGSIPLVIAQGDAGVEHKPEDWLKKFGVACVSREWILDSISTYQLHPIRMYLFQDKPEVVALLRKQGIKEALLAEPNLCTEEY